MGGQGDRYSVRSLDRSWGLTATAGSRPRDDSSSQPISRRARLSNALTSRPNGKEHFRIYTRTRRLLLPMHAHDL